MQVQRISEEAASGLFSIELEQQVLGALLQHSHAVPMVAAAGGASLFFDGVHGEIFDRIRDFADEGETADAYTLAAWARAQDNLADIGGAEYLLRMQLSAVATAALPDYIAQLADLAMRRTFVSALDEARRLINQGDEQVSKIAGRLEQSLGAIAPARGDGAKRIGAAVMEAVEDLEARWRGEGPQSVASGVYMLDKLLGGLEAGSMTLIGGRPSMGKTAVALQIAQRDLQ
ncbi:MAG: DnaB-like helicase N-terminal domain-containing protein, partial [Pseudomonadota bacterium]